MHKVISTSTVRMHRGRSVFDIGGFLIDFQGIAGQARDVVTERGLRPRVRERGGRACGGMMRRAVAWCPF